MEDADQMLQEESVQPGEIIYHPSSRVAKKRRSRKEKKNKTVSLPLFFFRVSSFFKTVDRLKKEKWAMFRSDCIANIWND